MSSAFYEAGILGGVDDYGTFYGSGELTQAEAAVMVARVLEEGQRLNEPPKPMPAADPERKGPYLMAYYQREEPDYQHTTGVLDETGRWIVAPGNFDFVWPRRGLWGQLRPDGSPASGWFDNCGEIGPDRGEALWRRAGRCTASSSGRGNKFYK